MPVILAQPIVPLSSTWTNEKLVNEIRSSTSELDNEKIQNTMIRNHLNQAIAFLVDMLNTAQRPDYGITWRCTLESTEHPTGLDWINLATPVAVTAANAWEALYADNANLSAGQMLPYAHLWGVKALTAKPSLTGGEQNSVANTWKNNCQLLTATQLGSLANGYNDQYRQSICYNVHGKDVLLYIGSQITSAANVAPAAPTTYFERPKHFIIWGYRQPLLDNLLPEPATGSSWKKYVDIPDKHIRLVTLLTQKMTLESIQKAVDNGTEQIISQQIQQIRGAVNETIQADIAEQVKQKQGFSAR